LVEEVRKSVRVEDITEYEGLPAGPRVGAGDAVIVVEGRADVLTLLRYGIKNAVAVEGTNVPEAVAALTADRTATAFLDGDRGGDLILKELAQVGDVDYVAISPSDRSVEDLTRREALAALREKIPYAEVAAADDPRAAVAGPETDPSAATAEAETDGSGADVDSIDTGAIDAARPNTSEPAADVPTPAEIEGFEAGTSSSRTDAATRPAASEPTGPTERAESTETIDAATSAEASETTEPAASSEPTETGGSGEPSGTADSAPSAGTTSDETDEADVVSEANAADEADRSGDSDDPGTLHGHVWAVAGTGTVRVLDAAFATLVDAPIEGAFDAIESVKNDPMAVVMDGEVTQRILDVAAQRGVEQVVAREEGSFVKQPTSVRVRTASELRSE
jgi:DNA primase